MKTELREYGDERTSSPDEDSRAGHEGKAAMEEGSGGGGGETPRTGTSGTGAKRQEGGLIEGPWNPKEPPTRT